MQNFVSLKVKDMKDVLVKKGEENSITNFIELQEECEAPIEDEKILGYLTYKSCDEEVARFPIVSSFNVEKISFLPVFKTLLKFLFKI